MDSNNNTHIIWADLNPGSWEIYYKKSTDGGTTWDMKRLTYNSGYSVNPAIAVDSNNYIHVVWEDLSPGDREIFYKRSTNGGTSWITRRLSWISGKSMEPTIAVDSIHNIHVAWHDDGAENREIFYRKGIQ